MNDNRHPITTLFRIPEAGCYGFTVHFEGREPHHRLDTCQTPQDALDVCDPHHERIWEEVNDSGNTLMISRAYKEGSCLWRMERSVPSGRGKRSVWALDQKPAESK